MSKCVCTASAMATASVTAAGKQEYLLQVVANIQVSQTWAVSFQHSATQP
jgi:hypothetical protein